MTKYPITVFLVQLVLSALAHATQGDMPAAERERALSSLSSDDPASRREAYGALGKVGRQEDLPLLFAALYDRDPVTRRAAENSIWQVWGRSGDQSADRDYARGVEQMQRGLLRSAVATFSNLIESHPHFAEAWNKRATIYFLLGEDDRSIADCEQVLKRNPHHFGALSGYGQLMIRKGNIDRAVHYFQRALTINPNMDGVRAIVEHIEKLLEKRRERQI